MSIAQDMKERFAVPSPLDWNRAMSPRASLSSSIPRALAGSGQIQPIRRVSVKDGSRYIDQRTAARPYTVPQGPSVASFGDRLAKSSQDHKGKAPNVAPRAVRESLTFAHKVNSKPFSPTDPARMMPDTKASANYRMADASLTNLVTNKGKRSSVTVMAQAIVKAGLAIGNPVLPSFVMRKPATGIGIGDAAIAATIRTNAPTFGHTAWAMIQAELLAKLEALESQTPALLDAVRTAKLEQQKRIIVGQTKALDVDEIAQRLQRTSMYDPDVRTSIAGAEHALRIHEAAIERVKQALLRPTDGSSAPVSVQTVKATRKPTGAPESTKLVDGHIVRVFKASASGGKAPKRPTVLSLILGSLEAS